MPDEQVQPVAPDGQTGASTQEPVVPSLPQPGTPSTPDIERMIAERVEKESRRLQSLKDQEVARERTRARQEAQAREAAIRQATVERLKQAGDQNADQWNQQLDLYSKAAEYDKGQEAQSAQQAAWEWGANIVRSVASAMDVDLDYRDPKLWEPFQNWDEFTDRARKVGRDALAAKKTAEKAALDEADREALRKRISAGELSTLGGVPAGAVSPESLETLTTQLAVLQKKPTANRAAITEMTAKLAKLVPKKV